MWYIYTEVSLLQTDYHSCTLVLVLDVKSKIQLNCTAPEIIQADGRDPLEGLKALSALRGPCSH